MEDINLKEKIKNHQHNKYLLGKNLIISALIALIPASLAVSILRDILRELKIGSLLSSLVLVSVIWGLIYLVGLLRKKISQIWVVILITYVGTPILLFVLIYLLVSLHIV